MGGKVSEGEGIYTFLNSFIIPFKTIQVSSQELDLCRRFDDV